MDDRLASLCQPDTVLPPDLPVGKLCDAFSTLGIGGGAPGPFASICACASFLMVLD